MHKQMPPRLALWVTTGCVLLLGGCGQPNSKPASLMVTSTAARTADIYLVAGYNRNNLWNNYNGYANGKLRFQVPVGYRVTIHLTNDGGVPYDVGVYTKDQQLAFPGAGSSTHDYVMNADAGVMPGSSAKYSFVADRVGAYRLADLMYLFPQHSPTRVPFGMWDEFDVIPTGTAQVTVH